MAHLILVILNYFFASDCIEKALTGLNKQNLPYRTNYYCALPEERDFRDTWKEHSKTFLSCDNPVVIYRADTSVSKIEKIANSASKCKSIGDSIKSYRDSIKSYENNRMDSIFAAKENILAKQIAKYSGTYPGNIGLEDSKESLEQFLGGCDIQDPEIMTELCSFKMDSSMAFKIGTFESNSFYGSFYYDPESQLKLPYQITIVSQSFDECTDAVTAKEEVSLAMIAKYSRAKSSKVSRGPKYGSKKCKDYMNEGLTVVTIKNGNWLYSIDSYWYDSMYSVTVKYHFLPRLQSVLKIKNNTKIKDLLDGFGKI